MKELLNSEQNQELRYIHESLDRIFKKLTETQKTNPSDVFFDNQEFIIVMNISKRTAQEWRNQNIIGYSQVGKKFYYRLQDILNLLDKFYKPSNN